MKTIRASELNAYLYCQRAWWYQISGAESENTAEMLMGQAVHEGHARSVKAVGCLRTLAAVLLLASLILFAAFLTTLVL
jgi:CRISPR/Cas system-associated exonuclease Cas4 (RecB family)